MKKGLHSFFSILLFLLLFGCSTDESNVSQKIETASESDEEEHRIISTTVAITEIMDALELDLIGVPSSYKDLPERYNGLPEVGMVKTPDLEIIKSLKPTDVLNVSTLEYDLKPVYEEVGIEASFLNLDSLENMLNTIQELGEKYEREKQAEDIVTKINRKLDEIKSTVEGNKQPTVLILLGIPGSYLVATEHSYIGDLVKQLGGVNVVTSESVEYVASNTEYLQQSDPDIILRAAHGMPEEVVKMFDQEFRENDIWKHFNAVKNNRVYDLEERIFGTTGNLGVEEALDELVKMLYPQ